MTTIQIKVPNWLDFIITCPLLAYRLFHYGEVFRRIYLDEGLWAIVNLKDYYRFSCFKWCIDGKNGSFYAVRGKRIDKDNAKIVRLHREIMDAPDGLFVDHFNHNGLDNRRSNLRLATREQNNRNCRKRKGCSSKFKGVCLPKNSRGTKPWRGYIKTNGRRISLGYFATEIEAAKAYDAAARMYHKEFARLNFPEENSLSAIR
ncbi:MAG: HNH endonuclease [Sedimentisphaerales bacterium]